MDIQSSWGFVCCWVTDEHRLQAIGKLQSPVHPFVLRRANYFTKHSFHSRLGHFEWRGWHQPGVEGIEFEFSQESVLLCSQILELTATPYWLVGEAQKLEIFLWYIMSIWLVQVLQQLSNQSLCCKKNKKKTWQHLQNVSIHSALRTKVWIQVFAEFRRKDKELRIFQRLHLTKLIKFYL